MTKILRRQTYPATSHELSGLSAVFGVNRIVGCGRRKKDVVEVAGIDFESWVESFCCSCWECTIGWSSRIGRLSHEV